jgi:hypothetical protein
MIDRAFFSGFAATMSAAVKIIPGLDAMADDAAAAVPADGGERMNGAFERIERVRFAIQDDLEATLVGISAVITGFHDWMES